MKRYVCTVCGFVYDEAKGIPDAGIAPGTLWQDLPEDWVCPLCGASKGEFREEGGPAPVRAAAAQQAVASASSDLTELSARETAALCSNLAKGCEKQYMTRQAALFTQLSDYFTACAAPEQNARTDALLALATQDLERAFPPANDACAQDRGALRALTWSEKVTRILKSLLARYEKEGDAMLQNTGVYVCTVCGFVFIGDRPPELCPVCKVPGWKFEKMEGRA